METNRRTDVKTVFSPRSVDATGVTDAQVLIEGDFIELDAQLRFVRDVHIFVSGEFVYVKELRNGRELKLAHLLQHGSGRALNKFRRSNVTIKVKKDCCQTFKAKWEAEGDQWKIYRMGKGNDANSWSKWLRFFGVTQHTPLKRVPSLAVNEDFSDSSSESDLSEGEDEDIPAVLFRPLTLSVDRAISTWSMSMLNPSTVRKLNRAPTVHSSLGTIGSENEDPSFSLDLEPLFRSNSIPRLSQTRSFRSPSLPDVSELQVTCVDANLWRSPENLKAKTSSGDSDDTRSGSSASEHDSQPGATDPAEQPAKNVVLQKKIETLRAETAKLNFVRKGRGSETTWDILMSPYNRRYSLSVAMNNEANRIPLEDESSGEPRSPLSESSDSYSVCSLNSSNTSEQLKLVARQLNFDDESPSSIVESDQKTQPAFRRIWTRLSKRRPKSRSESSWSPNQSPNQVEDTKTERKKSKSKEELSTPKLTGFVVANIRRGGVSNNISGRKEGVMLSHVMKAESTEDASPPVSPVHTKPEPTTEVTPVRKISSVSAGSTKKKLVQKILSPIFKSGSVDDSVVLRRASYAGDVSLSSDFRASTGTELPQRLVDIDAMTFAREITLIDKVLLIKISWEELATCGWMTKDKHLRSPNVMAMVEFFNRIALLVASEILSESTPVLRARVIARVIQIADKCRRFRNYNSLKALLAGLQSTPIYRLQESWAAVPSKRKKKFRELSLLMTEEDNFAAYRAELDSLPGPCIPFLGNVLTQIAQTQAYASIRRKRQKRAKESPTPADKVSTDETDGARPNGVAKCNGYRNDETTPPPPRPVSPRDMYKRHPKKEPQSKSRDRTPKSASRISKNRRKYGRYSSDTGIIGNRIRTASSEQLASPVDSLDRTLNLSRSDSVIANTMALEEEQGQSSPASARPALLRRLSESSSSASSLNGKSRRFSEASRPSSFLRNFVKRSQSSHSVKEGSLSRKASSERLSVSACNMKDECLLSRDTFARLGPAKSTPTVRATRDQLPGEVAQACGQSLSTKSSGTSTESRDSTSGTENQLWKYQLAAIEYDFPTHVGVKQFLLDANFNTEEDNYRLSLKREEPITKT